jgi:Putative beta barrel porin-7 (BBP7)
VRKKIVGSMATLALGAGMAFGQSGPSLQQGLYPQGGAPAYATAPYGAAPAFPMSMPPAAPSFPAQFVPPPQAVPTFPEETLQPRPATVIAPQPAPATVVAAPLPVEQMDTGLPVPGQPLTADPADTGKDDRSGGDDKNYGPGPCPYRFWGSAEYLRWWIKPDVAPPALATTSPAGTAAILGQPGTVTLFGGSDLEYGSDSGVRATFGFWFDKEGHIGAELTGFLLGVKSINNAVASDAAGSVVFGRPIVNAQTGMEASSLVSSPGQLAGGISMDASSQVYGGEVNFLGSLYRSRYFTADTLIGFRYLGLDEKLNIDSNTTVLPGGIAAFNGAVVAPGGTVTILDHFETRNDFYGGQIGGRAQVRCNRLFAELEGKLAVGNAHEVVNAGGSTMLSGTGGPAILPGGLLAVSSNSGTFSRNEFTFVPEGGAKIGVHITDYITAFAGYTFIYWYDVARPSEQIDRVINPALVPSNLAFGSGVGPNRPFAPFSRTDFWAQGVSVGLEVRY